MLSSELYPCCSQPVLRLTISPVPLGSIFFMILPEPTIIIEMIRGSGFLDRNEPVDKRRNAVFADLVYFFFNSNKMIGSSSRSRRFCGLGCRTCGFDFWGLITCTDPRGL